MEDLPLEQLPREGEIIEVVYRLSRPVQTHLDMTVAAPGGQRRFRFIGPRVVQFQPEMPEVLRGLEVQDIRDQNLGELSLWVSVAQGALTFWAKRVSEITARRRSSGNDLSAYDGAAAEALLVEAEHVREWESSGIPQSSFRYRSTGGSGGALRHFSISTRPFVH